MESLASVLEAMVAEKEMEASIPTPDVIAPKKEMEPPILTLQVIAPEKKMESPIHALEAMACEQEIEPSVLVSDVVAPEAEALVQEAFIVLPIESVISISDESVGPMGEDPLPGESVALEAEIDIPSAIEMNAPTVSTDEPSVPVTDSPLDPAHPSPPLAIAQGSYRPRQLFSSLCISPIEFNCF